MNDKFKIRYSTYRVRYKIVYFGHIALGALAAGRQLSDSLRDESGPDGRALIRAGLVTKVSDIVPVGGPGFHYLTDYSETC